MFRNLVFTLVASASAGVTRLLFSIAVGRALGPEVLGSANLVLAAMLWLSLPATSGFATAITKFMAERLAAGDGTGARDVFAAALAGAAALTAVSAALLALFAGTLAPLFGLAPADVGWLLVLCALYNAYLLYKGAYYGIDRVARYGLVELLAGAVFLVALGALLLRPAPGAVLAPYLAANLAFLLVAAYDLRGYWRAARWRSADLWRLIGPYSLVVIVGNTASTGLIHLGTLFTGLYRPPAEVAYYGVAFAVVTPLYLLPRALALVSFPAVSRYHGLAAGDALRATTNATTRWLAVGMTLACGLVLLLSAPLLELAFGPVYRPAATTLQIMVAAQFLVMLSIPAVNLLTGTRARYARIPAWASGAGLALSVALWVVWIPRLGVVAAAWGYLAGTLLKQGVCLLAAYRLFPLDGRGLVRLLGAGAVALGAGLALEALIAGWPGQAAGAAAFVALFVLLAAPAVRLVAREAGALARAHSAGWVWPRLSDAGGEAP